jgi:hypothetical protein
MIPSYGHWPGIIYCSCLDGLCTAGSFLIMLAEASFEQKNPGLVRAGNKREHVLTVGMTPGANDSSRDRCIDCLFRDFDFQFFARIIIGIVIFTHPNDVFLVIIVKLHANRWRWRSRW